MHWHINLVGIIIIGAPPIIQYRDNSRIHEFDRAMENVYIELVNNVRVIGTGSVYAMYMKNDIMA